jgi:hypothetical protein
MRLTKVVLYYNLDEFGLKLAGDKLVLAVNLEAVAAPKLVLIVARKVNVEA